MRRRVDRQGQLIFSTGEEVARWTVPRPGYMREAEPLAHTGAWPSVDPAAYVNKEEQQANRRIFLEGKRQGKGPASDRFSAASEKKTG